MPIIGKVYTNLDNYAKAIWPNTFIEIPKVGSSIESKSGKRLKVVSITHCVETETRKDPYPYIKIEVNN